MPRISGGWSKVRNAIKDRGTKRHEKQKAKADAYVATKFALIPGFRRKPKQHKGKHPQTALDYFYTAKAEARRARRRRRRINEALSGGWGEKARQLAMEKSTW
jgi:hypothetical protein